MKLKSLVALPLVLTLSAAPVFAGTLGTVATEPPIERPVTPPPGGFNPVYITIVPFLLCAVICDSDDETTTTTTASAAVGG